MGLINLELRCPKNVNGISIDPNPSWNFNDLMSELSSLESKLYNNGSDSSLNPKPFIKSPARDFRKIGRREKNDEKTKAFVMRVEDVEMDEFDDEDEIEAKSLVPSSRFNFDDIYLGESDESDDEQIHQMQVSVMDKMGVVEGAFLELTHEHQLGVKDEIRNQLTALETQLVAEKETSISALVQVEKNSDIRRQMDRKLDLHYQRKIAEALDNHLTAIQRDHEHRSQLEERKIRDDAALEDAKRKEKVLQEEKLRQQKAKEEQEARLEAAKRAEEERKAAQEAEKLAKEVAGKLNKEENIKEDSANAQKAASTTSAANVSKEVKSTGNLVRAAVNALKLEDQRLQNYKELMDRNQSIISGSHTNFVPKERDIKRTIRQITGTIDNVRSKAKKLVEILHDPVCPQSISVAMFAKEVISVFETTSPKFNSSAFACGHVIVYVSSQVPVVMDCLLAEFQKACIYTVPKHIMYSKAAFETEETYYKAIGYREENGKIETTDSYLDRIGSLMKLYGALVQTVAQGVENMHGLEEGWAWLARFLNVLPPNRYTAVALEAFLEMAGFALHRKYKSQFTKVLNTISREFVPKLKARDPNAGSKISRIQEYIESKKFLQEPTGWRLQGALLSHTSVPEPEADRRQELYHHAPDRRFTYRR